MRTLKLYRKSQHFLILACYSIENVVEIIFETQLLDMMFHTILKNDAKIFYFKGRSEIMFKIKYFKLKLVTLSTTSLFK
jgi:hypothetical protein